MSPRQHLLWACNTPQMHCLRRYNLTTWRREMTSSIRQPLEQQNAEPSVYSEGSCRQFNMRAIFLILRTCRACLREHVGELKRRNTYCSSVAWIFLVFLYKHKTPHCEYRIDWSENASVTSSNAQSFVKRPNIYLISSNSEANLPSTYAAKKEKLSYNQGLISEREILLASMINSSLIDRILSITVFKTLIIKTRKYSNNFSSNFPIGWETS